jgi:flagellar biosynthesis chaperone FliJ
MNKEQLWNYIQEIIRGLLALSQLPTTSRLNELLKEKQSVKDAEARISELQKEKENLKEILARIQQEQVATEQRIPEYNYGDLVGQIQHLKKQLEESAPGQAELQQDLEDVPRQMEIFWKIAEENQKQVTHILQLTERRTGGTGDSEKDEKVNDICSFSGEDRKELQGWKVQLALKIVGRPRVFDTKQKQLRYVVGYLKGVALGQLMPQCDKISGKVKLDSLKDLIDLLDLAFGDQDKAPTATKGTPGT